MSLSESQYYEAKVFLKAVIDAHATLEDIARQQAQLAKLKFYESSLVSAAKEGQIKINGDQLAKGNGFENSKIAGISTFVKNYFSKQFGNFDKVKTTNQFATLLQKTK